MHDFNHPKFTPRCCTGPSDPVCNAFRRWSNSHWQATKVIRASDGTPGLMLNGFTVDEHGKWIAFEVVTEFGFEIWPLEEILTLSDEGGTL